MATLAGVVLPAILAPFVVALAACFVAWRGDSRKTGRSARAGGIAGAGLAAAYIAGHVAINGRPQPVPAEASQWLVHFAVAAGLLAALEAAVRLPSAARWALRLGLLGALLWLTLEPLVAHTWSGLQAALWLVGLGTALALLWAAWDRPTRLVSPVAILTAWLVATATAAPLLLLAGSARLGQMWGVLAAALAAPLLVLLVSRRDRPLHTATLLGPSVVAIGLWLNGAFYTEAHPLTSLSLLLAPGTAWLGHHPWVARRQRWLQALIVGGMTLLVLAPATGITVAETLAADDADAYYD